MACWGTMQAQPSRLAIALLWGAAACSGTTGRSASAGRPAPPASAGLPADCGEIEAEYASAVDATTCEADSDCTAERTGSLECFQGPKRINPRSTAGQRADALQSRFHELGCTALPCTPATGKWTTRCVAGVCRNEQAEAIDLPEPR